MNGRGEVQSGTGALEPQLPASLMCADSSYLYIVGLETQEYFSRLTRPMMLYQPWSAQPAFRLTNLYQANSQCDKQSTTVE